MTAHSGPKFLIAIACGGTGGHLFPGLAVSDALWRRGSESRLIVSQKTVDTQAIMASDALDVIKLPAVALQNRNWFGFLNGFVRSLRVCFRQFSKRRPDAVVAFGGFTAVPAILAGKVLGARTFLHESNAVPGRANRVLATLVNEVFVGYDTSRQWFFNRATVQTGTPVRPQFKPIEPSSCRISIGLDPRRPVLLVMGGSQGAAAVNRLVLGSLPLLKVRSPHLQYLHLTGAAERDSVAAVYREHGLRAVVRPFLTEMELALGAATLAVSRAGASSLAEFAAMRLPSILVPYPRAMDNHQYYNARALMRAGAARQMDQESATHETLVRNVTEILDQDAVCESMRRAVGQWHRPNAADEIAERMLRVLLKGGPVPPPMAGPEGDESEDAFSGTEQSQLSSRSNP